jgi:hypothetical protein
MHNPKAAGSFFQKGGHWWAFVLTLAVPFEIFLWSVLKTQPQTVECHFDESYDFTDHSRGVGAAEGRTLTLSKLSEGSRSLLVKPLI